MDDLMVLNGVKTMDSREIAELTNKRHDSVIRDIEEQIGKIGGAHRFVASYLSEQNKECKCYKLPYRETMILVSGYSVELRARVIDRWLELEKAAMPKTLPEALRAYANEVEAREKAEATSRRLLHDSSTFTTTEISKELGMSSAIALNEKLRDGGFIYKDARGRWLLTANYSELGYQNLKQKEANGIIIYYAEWTNKGRDWLLQIFGGSK